MPSLIQRAGGSLAVKTLPALYGAGLILLVVRVLPLGDFGRYGMAIAYMNLVAGLSRGLWGFPLVFRAARGERKQYLAPAFWFSLGTAIVGGAIGYAVLPLLGVGLEVVSYVAIALIVLVPRDIAAYLTQAEGRVWSAFLIEAGYFLGSLVGFAAMASVGLLRTAEAAMIVNLGAIVLSSVIGIALVPDAIRPGRRGDWMGTVRLGRWAAVLTLGKIFLQQGDALLAGIFFEPEIIAPYIAARTLLRMYALLSQSVNFLVVPSASRLGASGQIALLRHRLRTVLQALIIGLIPVNVVMWFLSPTLFPLVLGAKYIPAIPFFKFLMVVTFIEPLYSVLTNALAGIGRPQVSIPVLAASLILNVVANLVLLPIFGLWAAPVVLVLTYGVLAAGSLYLGNRYLTA